MSVPLISYGLMYLWAVLTFGLIGTWAALYVLAQYLKRKRREVLPKPRCDLVVRTGRDAWDLQLITKGDAK